MIPVPAGAAGGQRFAVEALLRRGRHALAAHELKLRVLLLLVAVVAAYHYSLTTLLRQVSLDTPLAYVGLVPAISLLLAAAGHRLPGARHDIRDRTVDYIIGLPLLMAALSVMVVAPIRLSLFFWLWRLDLLTLPLYAAGAVAILFGVRAMWRARVPILFLLLAWPVPYVLLVSGWLTTFTDTTGAAVDRAMGMVPIARPVAAGGGWVFRVAHDGQPFLLSIGSACAGANGMLGFLLVAAAFATLLSGALLPKLLWLGAGLALTWTLNLGRIVLIFAVGRAFGEGAAVSWLHPFAGTITFGAGVLLMIAALPAFRLRVRGRAISLAALGLLRRRGGKPARAGESRRLPTPAAPEPSRARGPGTAPWPLTGIVLVLASAGLLASANASLRHVQLVAQDLGAPRVQQATRQNAGVSGWSLDQIDSFPWADQYFGGGATWLRYEYEPQGEGRARAESLRYPSPVVMDVITTNDLSSFSTYAVETCYRYRSALVLQTRTVDLGSGVVGHAISSRADGVTWSSVYWEWPIDTDLGVRYERVVLTTSVAGGARAPDPAPPDIAQRFGFAQSVGMLISNGLGDAEGGPVRGAVAASQSFLVPFAHAIVQSDAAASTAGALRRPQPDETGGTQP